MSNTSVGVDSIMLKRKRELYVHLWPYFLPCLHARVQHGAGLPLVWVLRVGPIPVVLQIKQWLVPLSGEAAGGARLNLAVHSGLVVQGEGPKTILQVVKAKDAAGHGGVVVDALVCHHLPLLVTPALEEGCPHAWERKL